MVLRYRDLGEDYRLVPDATVADGSWKMIRVHVNTKPEARRLAEDMQGRIDRGLPPIEVHDDAATMEKLIPVWLASLINRNAKSDSYTVNQHMLPAFRLKAPKDIAYTDIVRWLDGLKSGDKPLSGGTRRGCLNLLSRFFGWAVARGYATVNPVRMLPRGERPKQKPKAQDAP